MKSVEQRTSRRLAVSSEVKVSERLCTSGKQLESSISTVDLVNFARFESFACEDDLCVSRLGTSEQLVRREEEL